MADTVGLEAGRRRGVFLSRSMCFPVHSKQLSQRALLVERGKPVWFPFGKLNGKLIASDADGHAGNGSWRKRTPGCNDLDTGLNVTRHESVQTSGRSLIVRELGELR